MDHMNSRKRCLLNKMDHMNSRKRRLLPARFASYNFDVKLCNPYVNFRQTGPVQYAPFSKPGADIAASRP